MKSRLTLLEEVLDRTWVVMASPVNREVLASTSQRAVTGKHFSTYAPAARVGPLDVPGYPYRNNIAQQHQSTHCVVAMAPPRGTA